MVRASVPLHDSVTVIPGFFDLTHVLNSGAAFGILNGADFPFKTVIIAVIATAALIGVGIYAASLAHHQLVAAHRPGADHRRRRRQPDRPRLIAGSVVDFVDVYWRTLPFLGVQRRRLGDYRRRDDA